MAPRPAPPALLMDKLMDELVEQILLRIPPDDPARLLRAALVCKSWGRIVSDPGFRRRYPVLCASTDGTCDHLDCAKCPTRTVPSAPPAPCGHFLVVYVCNFKTRMFAYVYSSESASWREISVPSAPRGTALYTLPSVLVGNALYFMCCTTALKYDLLAQEMSLIPVPWECKYGGTILRTTEGGRLGLASLSSHGVHLYLWSREVGPEGNVGWTKIKVIKLRKLFPDVVNLSILRLAGFAHDLDVVLVSSSVGTFTIELKSMRAKKVHTEDCSDICFPYMSFYNPALGAASAEGSRTGTSNA